MADLVITDVDDGLRADLQRLAADHGRTVSDEARDLLRRAAAAAARSVGPSYADGPGLGTRLAANFAGLGTDFEIPELRGRLGLTVPDFNSPEFDR